MKRRDSGQAAVEAALTLPLMVFLFLGTLQLFLCYQARLLAVYAASRAASAGARSHAQCRPMEHAAVAALIPSIHAFARGNAGDAAAYGDAFRRMTQSSPYPQFDGSDPHSGKAVFWLVRGFGAGIGGSGGEEESFDLPNGSDRTFEVKLIYWFPMRIPFANWVISSMFRAHYGLQDYLRQNPLIISQGAQWTRPASAMTLNGSIAGELQARAVAGAYACPVVTGWATRLMTPLRDGRSSCPPAPNGIPP